MTREDLLKMAINARKLGRPDATEAIANEIEEVAL
jgi:UDP-N-acetylglucosamine:LPS N-acetylglucosamine transferase